MFSMDGPIYRLLSFLYRCMVLNLLYILSCILIVTIPPATAGLFAVTRKWVYSDEPPIFRTFMSGFRENLKQSYVTGIVFFIIGFVLWVDLRAMMLKHWAFGGAAEVILLAVGLFAAGTLTNIFPLMVHVEQSTRNLFVNAMKLNFVKPHLSLLNLVVIVVWSLIASRFTILIPVVYFSLLALIVYWSANQKFRSIEALQAKAAEATAEETEPVEESQ